MTVGAIVHVAMAAVVTHKLGGTWCRSWWWNVQGQNVTMLVVDWFKQVVVMVEARTAVGDSDNKRPRAASNWLVAEVVNRNVAGVFFGGTRERGRVT